MSESTLAAATAAFEAEVNRQKTVHRRGRKEPSHQKAVLLAREWRPDLYQAMLDAANEPAATAPRPSAAAQAASPAEDAAKVDPAAAFEEAIDVELRLMEREGRRPNRTKAVIRAQQKFPRLHAAMIEAANR